MKAFLQLVAEDLREKFGTDLSRLVVVFPNKRAELFMNDYLLAIGGDSPVWAPRYTTIRDLFLSFSTLGINDPIDSVCRIHQLYADLASDSISLDLFYGWAERILSDFDDIDKNMVNADRLLRNLADIKELENTDYLTDEQVRVLCDFFVDFSVENNSEIKERFRVLWDTLNDLYHRLNDALLAEGLAYEGALFRRVAERIKSGENMWDNRVDKYVIVGFNVLDRVEQELFSEMKKAGKALFYWDYDKFYAPASAEHNHFEAGLFVRENLLRFGNELSEQHFDNLSRIPHVEMVAASTEAVQAQSVAGWLRSHLTPDPKRTAVVLCNENLLQPLLHALPENVSEVNITKGYPLAHTDAATLVEQHLARWERHASPPSTEKMLTALIDTVNETARAYVGAETFTTDSFDHVLQSEAYYLMSTLLNRLLNIARSGRLLVNAATLHRLVRQITRQSTIPFHGEPAVGLQIMGVLETRCLDFDHIVMLSVNEGVLPQSVSDHSFIPYLLRRAYGLTTPERRTAVYAYYFYRLIQRAQRLRLLYNSSSEGMVQGEMSRFMTQLLVESPIRISHRVLTSEQKNIARSPVPLAKPADLQLRLARPSKVRPGAQIPYLSPSAINTYLRCPLLFYYQYVGKFKEPKPDKDDIRPNVLGTIFHAAAENIYQDFRRSHAGSVDPELLQRLSADRSRLDAYIRRAFDQAEVDYRVLEASVVELYLRSLLRHDSRMGNFQILATEHNVSMLLPLPSGAAAMEVEVGGQIDRLDLVNRNGTETLRILDYKTGGKEETAASLEEIFTLRGSRQKHYMLQTFLYSLMMAQDELAAQHPLAPALFFVNHAQKDSFSPYLRLGGEEVTDFGKLLSEFRERLQSLVAEILDPDLPFSPPDPDDPVCKNCKYYALCYQ